MSLDTITNENEYILVAQSPSLLPPDRRLPSRTAAVIRRQLANFDIRSDLMLEIFQFGSCRLQGTTSVLF